MFIHRQVEAMLEEFPDINMKGVSPVPYTPILLSLILDKYKGYLILPRKLFGMK